jgi:hypothetical protein
MVGLSRPKLLGPPSATFAFAEKVLALVKVKPEDKGLAKRPDLEQTTDPV